MGRSKSFAVAVIVGCLGGERACGFLFPPPVRPNPENQRHEGRQIQADKWMTPEPPKFDLATTVQQAVFQLDDMIQNTLAPFQDMFNFSAIAFPDFSVNYLTAPPATPVIEEIAPITTMEAGGAVLDAPPAARGVSVKSSRWAETRRSSYGKPPRRNDDEEEEKVVEDPVDSLVDRGVLRSPPAPVVEQEAPVVEEAVTSVADELVDTRASRWRKEEERTTTKSEELDTFISAVDSMTSASSPVAVSDVSVMSTLDDIIAPSASAVVPVADDYWPIVIPADEFPPVKLVAFFDETEEETATTTVMETVAAAPAVIEQPAAVVVPPVVSETVVAAPAVVEKEEAVATTEKAVITSPVVDVHAAAAAVAREAAAREQIAVRPELAALLTGDTVIYSPRKSVEDILVESKMQAVEEYHRAKTQDQKMSFEEKVALLEDKLLEEIRDTPVDGVNPSVSEYIEVLEKVGEQQERFKNSATHEGSWDMVYSSTPHNAYLSMPKWLNRFMSSFRCEVKMDARTIMYRVVFRIFKWLPAITRQQTGTLHSINGRKTLETLNKPLFTLGKINLSKLPFSRLFSGKSRKQADEQRLSNDCTFLGSNVRICRVTPVPFFGGEETLAVFARRRPETEEATAKAADALKAIEPISKLFSKFGRRKNRKNAVRN